MATDPWMGEEASAYFGSWNLNYNIPEDIKKDIVAAKYIWFSHGHPDHINHDSLNLFKNNKILVSEHFGGRIYNDLKSTLDTKQIRVTTIYKTRGGFDTTCIEGELD